MENIDGALAFRATLDIDDFNVSAQAMENRIKALRMVSNPLLRGLENISHTIW